MIRRGNSNRMGFKGYFQNTSMCYFMIFADHQHADGQEEDHLSIMLKWYSDVGAYTSLGQFVGVALEGTLKSFKY